MRSLALAEGWISRGVGVTLIGRGPEPILQRFRQVGAEVIELAHSEDPAASEVTSLPQVIAAIRRRAWCVVDGYRFTASYTQALRDFGLRVLVLDDDQNRRAYSCDVLLNQNLGADKLTYTVNPGAIQLLGSRYALLRREFRDRTCPDRKSDADASRVLVTLGGSDPLKVTELVIDAMLQPQCRHLTVRVLVGPANDRAASLMTRVAGTSGQISILAGADVAEQLCWADMLITSAGSTVWEAAFAGLPMLLAVTADNQMDVASQMVQAGAAQMITGGAAPTIAAIAGDAVALSVDARRRALLSTRARGVVDGGGVDRVIDACVGIELRQGGLVCRLATADDSRDIWALANQASVRARAFSSAAIDWDTHVAWYSQKLVSSTCRMWVVRSRGGEGDLVGQIRYDRADDDVAEIGFSVDEQERGRGLGAAMLSLTFEEAVLALNTCVARGLVIEGNHASASAFVRAGYTHVSSGQRHDRSCWIFERRLGGRKER